MKKHITQSAIDEVAEIYRQHAMRLRSELTDADRNGEANYAIAIVETFSILTGQDYDAARMMLRKRSGII